MFGQIKITATLIGVIALLALITYTVVITKQNRVLRQDNKDLVAYSTSKSEEVSYYKNKLGNEVAKTEVLSMSNKTLRKLAEEDRLMFLEQFESINRRMSNISQAQNVTTETINRIKIGLKDTVIVNGTDTIPHLKSFQYTTEFDSISGVVYADSIQLDYKIEVPLSGIIYQEKRKFKEYVLFWKLFKKREWKTEFASRNPNTKITGIDLIEIQ